MTKIEWTDETWNPLAGCSHVSAGCDGCYAARDAFGRLSHTPTYKGLAYRRAPDELPRFTGEVRLLPDRLDQPLRWKRPRRVFVNSMSDLFHEDVPNEFVVSVFVTMARARQHTFQVLTKRPQRMARLLNDPKFNHELYHQLDDCDDAGARAALLEWEERETLPNVWLGTSVENQPYANIRIPHLLATPAAVRFLSVEPLLGPVVLADDWLQTVGACPTCEGRGSVPVPGGGKACDDCFDDPNGQGARTTHPIDWVIVGGESGPRARPMDPTWARALRDQCVAAEVPFLFKQWGEWMPFEDAARLAGGPLRIRGTEADPARMARVGKRTAGRELDGRTWDEYPT